MKSIHSATGIPPSLLGQVCKNILTCEFYVQIQDDEQGKFFNFFEAADFSSYLKTTVQLTRHQLQIPFGKCRGLDSVLVIESEKKKKGTAAGLTLLNSKCQFI